jgi:hypothetical protein
MDHQVLRRSIPCFEKVGLFAKKILCYELATGTIPEARNHPDSKSILDIFTLQFIAYAWGEPPLILPSTTPASTFSPLMFWKELLRNPDACFLAVCVKT